MAALLLEDGDALVFEDQDLNPGFETLAGTTWKSFVATDKACYSVADNAALDLGTGDIFLHARVMLSTTGAARLICSKFTSVADRWFLWVNSSNYVRFDARVGGATVISLVSSTTELSASVAYDISVLVDRSDSANNRIYVNGVSQSLSTNTSDATSLDNGSSLIIGDDSQFIDPWNGYLAQIAIGKPADASTEACRLAAYHTYYNSGRGLYYNQAVAAGIHTTLNITAAWDCTDPTGTTLTDQSGGGNHGTLATANMLSNPGFETRAGTTWKSFVASDKACYTAGSAWNPGTSDFTIALSFKPTNTTADYRALFSTGGWGAGYDGITLYQYGTDLYIEFCDSVQAVQGSGTFTCGLSGGTRYAVVLSCDRDGNATLYLNDVSKGTVDISGHQASLGSSGNPTVGALANGSVSYPYHGQVAQVGVWTRLLTGGERTSYYNSGLGKYYGELTVGEKTDCTHFWDCTDPTGTTLTDQSGGGNHGTMVAAELFGNTGFETAGGGGADIWGSWDELVGGTNTLADELVIVDAGAHAAKLSQGDTYAAVRQSVATNGRSYVVSCRARGALGGETLTITAGDSGGSATHAVTAAYATYSSTLTTGVSLNPGFFVYGGSSSVYVDTVSCKAASIPTVSDADLFGSWTENVSGTSVIHCETTSPAAGAVDARIETDSSGNYGSLIYYSILTVGRTYQQTVIAKSNDAAKDGWTQSGGVVTTIDLTTSMATTTQTFTAAHAHVEVGTSSYSGGFSSTMTIQSVSVTAASIPTVSDADLFGSWTESGTVHVETTAPDAGSLSLILIAPPSASVTQSGVMTVGRTYTWSLRGIADVNGRSIYNPIADTSTVALTNSWATHTGTGVAGNTYVQLLRYDDATFKFDTVSVTATTMPGANGAAEAKASDSVGSNHGTLVGRTAATLITDWSTDVPNVPVCAGGYSLNFDGVDDYVDATSGVAAGATYTIAGWVKFDSLTGDMRVWSVRSGGAGSTGICCARQDGTGYLRVLYESIAWGNGTYTPALNTWLHCAIVRNGTVATLYVDGVSVSVLDNVATETGTLVRLGAGHYGGNVVGFFDGKLDDVRIYSSALTAFQVTALAAGDDTGGNWPGTPTVAHWKFDDGPMGIPADTDPIAILEDQADGRIQFQQTTLASRPTAQTDELNGRTVLQFDGTDDNMTSTNTVTTETDGSWPMVFVTGNNFSAERVLWSSSNSGVANQYICAGTDTSGKLFLETNIGGTTRRATGSTALMTSRGYYAIWRHDGTTALIELNGLLETMSAPSGQPGWWGDVTGRTVTCIGALVLSTGTTAYWKGQIAEFELYDSDPSLFYRIKLSKYHRRRYDV